MEKNKGRVDMLAAGRKKLQQYRQKKDGKPSGKSAKKSTKHGHPGDSSSKPDSSQLPEGDIAAPPDDSSSTLHSTDTGDVANLLPNDAQLAQEPATLQQGDADSSVPPSTVIEGAHDADANSTTETVSSDQQNRMDEPDSSVPAPVKLKTETTIEDEGRDSLPTQDYIPDTSSFTARGDDEVTDLQQSTEHGHPDDSSKLDKTKASTDSSQILERDIAAPDDSSTLHSTDSLMLPQHAIASTDSSSETGGVVNLLANDPQLAQEPATLQQDDADSSVPPSRVIEGAQNADANRTTETASSDQQNRMDEPDSLTAPVKLETESAMEDEGRDPLLTEEYIPDTSSLTARGDEVTDLQKYQQKKDDKESAIPMIHGHPDDSSKLDETKASTDSSQIPERDIAAPDDSSTLHSTDSLMLSQHTIASTDASSETGGVVNLLANDAQLAQEPATLQQDDADSSVPSSEIEGAQDADANRTTETVSSDQQNRMDGVLNESDSVPALEETSVPSSEIEGAHNADANRTREAVSSDGVLNEPDSVTALEEAPIKLETETAIEDLGRDPLHTEEYIPDISSFTARGDQVTDVGAMQEADYLGSKQFDGSGGAQLEESLLAASTELHENAKAFEAETVGGNSVEGESSKIEQENETDAASVTAVATNFSDSDGISDVTQIAHQPTEFYQQHDHLVKEVSFLRASLDEVNGRSACCEEELANSRSQLLVIAGERQELQKQLQTAMSEAEEFSSRARELEISFGRSQEGFSVLSAELADCKSLVVSLQVENETLNGNLVSLTEEKNKLSDEKESSIQENEKLLMELTRCNELVASSEAKNEMLNATLASATEEQKQLLEDKESSRDMNEKLSVELADCKNLVTALQVENETLNGNLVLLTEEKNKLSDEKESSLQENEKLLMELTRCNELVASLEAKYEMLNATLASATEEQKQLLENKESSRDMNENLSVELADCKNLVAALQMDNSDLSTTLSLIREEKEKLEHEKELYSRENQAVSVEFDECKLQYDIQILALEESLHQAEESLHAAVSKLQGKISELEQSEQRVSSIREKLSMAVAKGKGLIVQRDSLKQTLAETSSELDRCSQELQLKDARVEALESELSYIRNSATAIRESFLLKDSVLQRIEEILEDLDLPEHFHSGDIIEKVDWLARSAAADSSHPTDWEQKSSVEAGFVTVDAWKEDEHPDSNSGEELRRQFEELQRKFYELAEQNEMLEQSLMERNHLVQRWEELLNQIHMPSHLRTMEPEDRIEWLGSALREASNERDSLQRKIDYLEDCGASLTADLEDSQKKISDLQADIQSKIHEREHLSERLQALLSDHDELSAKVVHGEQENERLQGEVTGLQDKLGEKLGSEERLLGIEASISRLEGLVSDALQDPGMSGLVSGGSPLEFLEGLVEELIERYTSLKSVSPLIPGAAEKDLKIADETLDDERSRDALPAEDTEVASLKKQLGEALQELMSMNEERDRYSEKEQSLLGDVQELNKKREELLELLNQEEHKSASLREKLNIAVRKGKSVVQQRDALKQNLENVNTELGCLKSEISRYENSVADYELKIRELSSHHERAEALESENVFLRKRLEETEHFLQERERILTPVLNKLADIDFDVVVHTSDPVEKLEKVVKLCYDFNSAVASLEQESSKSKRALELLLAELNEVQERNDGLQEELAKASTDLTELMKQRDVAEAAKHEAVSHAQKLSSIHAEEERKRRSETLALISSLNQARGALADIFNLSSDTFSSNLELLKGLEASIVSCLKGTDTGEASSLFYNASGAVSSRSSQNKETVRSLDSWPKANLPDNFDDYFTADAGDVVTHHLQEFMNEIGALKEKLNVHLKSLDGQASSVSSVVGVLQRETASQKESFEALRGNIVHLESTGRQKDVEIAALSRNIALLYEACANAIAEIENRKTELLRNNLFAEDTGSLKYADLGLPFTRQTDFSSEECVKTMADRILLAVNEFAAMKSDVTADGLKEMKITVANLQKEMQEKDIQKDRICMELVAQIKKAEASAADYSREYHSSKTLASDLEKQVNQMHREREFLEQRVKDLHDVQSTSMELQNRVGSLTEKLSAKDLEIEALMQALDEEEAQMEELRRKIEGLEEVVQKKNIDVENLEASRTKVVKKLAITVSRFDELHDLSESLLSEVEKLQSQLQDRDGEISFLRNEVTRCTNDVLAASQLNNKRDSADIYELLTWFDAMVSRVEIPDVHDDKNSSIQAHECKELLQKRINTIISQLEDLRMVDRTKDAFLQAEKSKVEELKRREETLEKTLHEKESQLNLLQSMRDSGQATGFNTEIVEVEPVINKWTVGGTSSASQVRSLRKGNNDQVAIDMDPVGSSRLEDEDDDKVHGFKSLTTSRIIPKFTRPITDMVDGLWVSCDRALMRQPALRLGIMMYWAILHTLLAAFVF